MKPRADRRYPADFVVTGDAKAMPEKSSQRTIQSVERALTLLELVAREPAGLTLSELASAAGLNSSTCHHLAATLVARGYLRNDKRSRGYVLGARIRELHELEQGERDPSVLLAGPLQELGQRLGHGVQMAVMSENALITKLRFPDPTGEVEEADEIEKMSAAHATATGKSILAWIPDTELVRVISAHGLTRYTPRTVTSLSGLIEELRLVRRHKYAVDDEEFRLGICCIGASVRDGTGAVVGAISVTIPAAMASEPYRKMLIGAMVAAGNDFSRKIETATRFGT
ncbi:IclR family transcriptional regulator [Citreicella sp. C3M06]|uniref:IclR family transcriptional regulator n=1 Tax=Roseobacteraceae TaxID=2854170 RepID=UPI001C09B2DC|nr:MULTISPECIES: IclR family transcriptional regulator [Roseobacteraceae]MBU2960114.1 IclR family transcriptional regulator [Citreicella sp. C3M06]MDO6585813.1 IclR family transcriptional regulator [Salipiger sp. 1_MG-2023]